jgi:predicted NUDIX family phosphoesterase/dephospho-CoA kinase
MLRTRDHVHLVGRELAEQTTDLRQVVVYVALFHPHDGILSYIRGEYSSAVQMLKGSRCVGFGGHVLDVDRTSLFDVVDGGLSLAAYREIAEELKGVLPTALDTVGVIWDATSTEGMKHLGIVMRGSLPADFAAGELRRELSVAGVRFLSPAEAWRRYHELEFWSQLLIRHFFHKESPPTLTRVHPSRPPRTVSALVIVGEIATGKTTLCDALVGTSRFRRVSTRECVAELIDVKDFGTRDRTAFQEEAGKLVSTSEGTKRLAEAIAARIREDGTRIPLVDGLRNVGTLASLRELVPDIMVIFVDTPRDKALANYVARSGGRAGSQEFIQVREHPVEAEVPRLKHEADVLLYNGGRRDELAEVFMRWWSSGDR